MNNEWTTKKFLKNSIFFIVLIVVTFTIIFKENNINDILLELKRVNKIYVLIGVVCTFVYCLCEAFNFWTVLKSFDYKKSFISILKYPFVGFFFSSITPSASGGQPMQIYFMVKDKIKMSHASMAIFLEFATFQIATISLAIAAFFFNHRFITTLSPIIRLLILLGILVNSIIFLFVLCMIFSKKFTGRIARFIVWSGKRTRIIKSTQLIKRICRMVNEYQKGADFILQHKTIMVKVVVAAFIQVASLYSVSFWVYKALGFNEVNIIEMIGLQALVYISVSGMPLPGGVGASETVFLRMFKKVYSVGIIQSAMLLSRGISFYIFLGISGIMVLIFKVFERDKIEEVKNR